MTAIERRSASSFFNNAILSVLVFGALTGAAVLLRFCRVTRGVHAVGGAEFS